VGFIVYVKCFRTYFIVGKAGEGRVLHVHHVQFILVADKRGYDEGGHCGVEQRSRGR